MKYIEGRDARQVSMLPYSLEEWIGEENPVRVIEAFVNDLDMENLDFQRNTPAVTGRPGYDPRDLLKLYIYGYFNRIRSSRCLKRECGRNIEVMYLLSHLQPDFRTIADFRKDNAKAIKKVFREFVRLCAELKLYERELVAIDGSKFRAVNGNKQMFNENILNKKLERLEERITEYLAGLDDRDAEEENASALDRPALQEKLRELEQRKALYEGYLQELAETGEEQKCVTDPESRMMRTKNGFHCCYNVQTAVDAGSHLIAAYEVTNHLNDYADLHALAVQTSETPGDGNRALALVADKGYDSQEEVMACVMDGIIPHVGMKYDKGERLYTLEHVPAVITDEEKGSRRTEDIRKCLHAGVLPDCFTGSVVSVEVQGRSVISCFTRNDDNTVTCPMGQIMTPVKLRGESYVYQSRAACRNCLNRCTPGRTHKTVKFGPATMVVHTWMYGDSEHPPRPVPEGVRPFNAFFQKRPTETKVVLRIKDHPQLQKDRLGISEHPFGTVKWYHGAHYFLCKGIEKTSAEIALSYMAYNLTRALNMIGVAGFLRHFQRKQG